MARSPKKYVGVDLEGGIFDAGIAAKLTSAVNAAIEETTDEAAGIFMGFVTSTGFTKSGAFISRVDGQMRGSAEAMYGWVGAPWAGPGTAPATWGDQGTRGGRKLRKSLGFVSKTARRVNDLKFENFERNIAQVLE